MSTAIPETMQLSMEIMKMQEAIKRLPWHSFIERWKMKRELEELRSFAISVGIGLAVDDLVKMGFFKRVESN